MDNIILITIFLPLLGFLFSGIFYNKLKSNLAVCINSSFLITAAILSFVIFYDVAIQKNTYNILVFRWLDIDNVKITWSIYLDVLSVLMLVIVNVVSAVVHVYSAGYMSDEKNLGRFMSYLSLFTFFMLLLVTSDNVLQLFFGWEGVGLCSYLLIGYWYKKEAANNAALKAFWVNRIADVFFLVGLFSLFIIFDSFSFAEIFSKLSTYEVKGVNIAGFSFNSIDFITMLLFIGCMGKSAQIIFHVWLPDAMEGPTPVSALIHAATMVTAGVFLIVRLSPLFTCSDFTLTFITIVGSVTCLFAALIGMLQNDIKKIIAYSTCSQLGYMFFACGLSAYSAAMFHLGTHAFFKALLFLGAGSVIHSLSGEQDIRRMGGGIWRKIPFTYSMIIIGSLALVGIFPFAGYFSKDMILDIAYAKNNELGHYAYACGIIAVFCTAVYSMRLIYLVFHGEERNIPITKDKSLSMRSGMAILAVGSVFAGVLAVYLLKIEDVDLAFWNNSIEVSQNSLSIANTHNISLFIKLLPMIISVCGILMSFVFLRFYSHVLSSLRKKYSNIYAIILNKFYFDEVYDVLFVQPFRRAASLLSSEVEINIIDNKGPRGASYVVKTLSGYMHKVQTGFVYNYIAIMVFFLVIIMGFCIIKGMI